MKDSLGASFFFKRCEEDRGSTRKLFPPLAKQSVTSLPVLTPYIQKTIEADPYISNKALREQFEKLVHQPLHEMEQGHAVRMVIVIDATG
ncbi:WD domain-containing protein [Histoplasma ohiense]|nr:WD domain-containing protein [Histoplasma ohiense (nom. inval.)]